MNYRVFWRDGSTTDDVDYAESMRLIKERPEDWASVGFMDAGRDCNSENVKLKQKIWGGKK